MQKESSGGRDFVFPALPLGVFELPRLHPDLPQLFAAVKVQMAKVPLEERFPCLSRLLYRWIVSIPHPVFLLPSLLALLRQVNESGLLDRTCHFLDWERWLLFESSSTLEEELDVRSKIVGKKALRETYQTYFPIGSGRFYKGPHYVVAHPSPDLDTLVCSFWGWLDAFGAKVCDRLHIWCIPAGKVNPTDQALFDSLLGKGHVTLLSIRRSSLEPEALELSSPCLIRSWEEDLFSEMASYTLLVNDQGRYVGEWSTVDTENFYSAVMPLIHLLESFEIQMRSNLLLCFSEEDPGHSLKALFDSSQGKSLQEQVVFQHYSPATQRRLSLLFEKLFLISIDATMGDLGSKLDGLGIKSLSQFFKNLEHLLRHDFSKMETRLLITKIRETLSPLETVSETCLAFLKKGRSALCIKESVWQDEKRWVTPETPLRQLEELFQVKGSPLSLVRLNQKGEPLPLGYLERERVQSTMCGTLSLRDFSDRKDLHASPKLDVISVIDHHKTCISTTAPSFLLTANVQACSVLLEELEQAFSFQQTCSEGMYTHPERAHLFAISLLAAVFDDTDLLAKGQKRDCLAVHRLLEQLRGEQQNWDKGASLTEIKKKLLATHAAFEIYSKFFELRQNNTEKAIVSAASGTSFDLFQDTKGGDTLMGQSKLFWDNWKTLRANREKVMLQWVRFCLSKSPTALFYGHIVSTLLNARQITAQEDHPKDHQDQLWLTGKSPVALRDFLYLLYENELANQEIKIELINGNILETESHPILKSCQDILHQSIQEIDQPILVLHFPAGKLNSRKASVAPYIRTKKP
ncbi:hypothetical protein [Candidatus Similichlamydia laticola]|uniref:Uncharacterized protein n=1 Tax=Candidatus Similichlamydia laticola TaxID=2170265 RepID=A0A369KEK1_9BACT|nr:hypothetical protein [Candidatus Similichlamydia laticola]RDB31327.1 hypothetical protein HAT2_00569 [Candidatus Similichlamydia laticola]